MPLDQTTFDYDDPILSAFMAADARLQCERCWFGGLNRRHGKCPEHGEYVCAGLALPGGFQSPANQYLCNVVRHSDPGFQNNSIAVWNNEPGRTFEEVKALYHEAIAHRRAELAQKAVG